MTKENWNEIHEDFYEDNWGETYQQRWKEQGLTYQDAQEWILAGFEPNEYKEVKRWKNHNFTPWQTKSWIEKGLNKYDYNFAFYLKQKNIQPHNLPKAMEELRKEYTQNYLNLNYPNKQETKEIKINYPENLRGSLIIDDYPRLEKVKIISQENLAHFQINNCSNLRELDLSNNNLNQDLSFLKDLVNLRELNLGDRISLYDETKENNKFYGSLEFLKDMNKLEYLDITDTDIDSGLEYLPSSLKNFYCSADKRKDSKCQTIHNLFKNEKGEVERYIKNFPQKLKEYKQSLQRKKIEDKQKLKKFGYSEEEINQWVESDFLKFSDYVFNEYLKLKGYDEQKLNLTELKKEYEQELQKHKRIYELSVNDAVLFKRWKETYLSKLNQTNLQNQIKLLETEKQRLEELNQKLLERIPFLEKQIEESEFLIKEQKDIINRTYLAFGKEEKNALLELIEVHKIYLEAKKFREDSEEHFEQYLRVRKKLKTKFGKEFMESVAVILTNFEELYQREWNLQSQLREKQQNQETKTMLETQQNQINQLLQEAQKNMALIQAQEFSAWQAKFQQLQLESAEKQSKLITERVVSEVRDKLEEITEESDKIFSSIERPVLENKIGQGGFGEVYQGKHKNRKVAIKKMFLSDETKKQEIRNEINLLKKLKDRNIIQYYGVCYDDKEILIIMDYAENGTLTDFIKNIKEQDWNLNTEIIKQITSGLKYIHHENIIHRDLKSLNVLMTSNNQQAKIADFGLSRISFFQRNSEVIGSLRWMAPEVLKDKKYSKQSDIYALGMIIWEIAAKNTMPFKDMNDQAVAFHIMNGGKETIPGDTSQNIQNIIQYCWKSNPSERISLDKILECFKSNEINLPIGQDDLEKKNSTEPKISQVTNKEISLLESDLLNFKISDSVIEEEVEQFNLSESQQAKQQAQIIQNPFPNQQN